MSQHERVTFDSFKDDLAKLEEEHGEIIISFSPTGLFVHIGAIQLALRHPFFPQTSRKICEEFITLARDRIAAEYPKLGRLIDQGNDSRFDE